MRRGSVLDLFRVSPAVSLVFLIRRVVDAGLLKARIPSAGNDQVSCAGMNPLRSSANDPLHGITLEAMLTRLVERLGWKEMAHAIDIRCFRYDPSIKSSLQFLRRTPWARKKVEQLYLRRGVGPKV